MLALGNESKFQKFVAGMSKDNITMVILALDARTFSFKNHFSGFYNAVQQVHLGQMH
jgi:hypothetical protein